MRCEPRNPLHNAGDLFFIQPMSRSQRRRGRKAYQRLRLQMRKGESKHHLRCQSNGGNTLDDKGNCNISIVDKRQHDYWHSLFSNHLPPVIAAIINKKWLDQRWEFICVERKHEMEHS